MFFGPSLFVNKLGPNEQGKTSVRSVWSVFPHFWADIYIYTLVCIFMRIHIYACIFINIPISNARVDERPQQVYIFLYLYVYIYMCVYIRIHVYVYTCIKGHSR